MCARTHSLLVLFGWLQSEHSIGTEHPASPFLFQFPGAAWDGSVARRPLPLPRGLGARRGRRWRPHHHARTPNQHTGDLDPLVRVQATSLANCHAAIIEGRQRC
jgi:hypothetical protein